jgi:hypothetical protein
MGVKGGATGSGGISTGTGGATGGGSGTGTGTGGAGKGGAGTGGAGSGAGAGTSAAGAGSTLGGSITGAGSGGRGAGKGFFDCSVSGNWVVVFSGTLDSGVRENTVALSLGLVIAGGRIVMARLDTAGAAGLIGRTY